MFGSVLGGLALGALGYYGQAKANKANLAIARENRAWQERMSNTAYRRAAADLEAAGLNRILAFGRPATTPGGNVATMQNEAGAGVDAAVSGARAMQDLKLVREQTKNTMWDTSVKEAQSSLIKSQDAETVQRTLNLTTARDVQQLNKEILELRIPGVQAEADLWRWLDQVSVDEATKAMGKAGPLVMNMFRLFMIGRK